MGVLVASSFVADGTMNDRTNPTNQAVTSNRRTWLTGQGVNIGDAVRVKITYDEPENDYCRYREVTSLNKGEGMFDGNVEPADALVTTEPGVALFLPIADCVATTFYDEVHGVLMLSHLGRQSLEQSGGVKSVEYLKEHYGVNPTILKVWLSATVNKEVYPIFKLDNKGMKEALYEQLLSVGIIEENIIDNKDDTATDSRYFSYSEFLKGNKSIDGTYAMITVMQP